MKNLPLRMVAGLAAVAGAGLAYYISPALAITLSIGIEIALLGLAFVATPLVLERGPRGRQTILSAILLALSVALGLVGAAISGSPYMVVAAALALLALAVFMARSAAFTSGRHR